MVDLCLSKHKWAVAVVETQFCRLYAQKVLPGTALLQHKLSHSVTCDFPSVLLASNIDVNASYAKPLLQKHQHLVPCEWERVGMRHKHSVYTKKSQHQPVCKRGNQTQYGDIGVNYPLSQTLETLSLWQTPVWMKASNRKWWAQCSAR